MMGKQKRGNLATERTIAPSPRCANVGVLERSVSRSHPSDSGPISVQLPCGNGEDATDSSGACNA